ncbi:2-phospho-L-lactate guanylyltransferase [Haloarculaceae archaeon H-GB2-1]|nr:2-phospho-L-lactate guanylyltransferase [Haloarculaceae archaeon H-GB1-1]MEA5388594.1 2-phospho-L-lactate guanylyltransferase [Haloarculaceae archaeon H-GB11]MEA5406647.1 2-phospho-L-lactate guanylyltransferase [Haloarculaceae archaeon H-GB2-1]
MRVVVPFSAARPKTRLGPVLDDSERRAFAFAMLSDVLSALRGAGHEPTVLATEPVDCDTAVRVDDRPLTRAVNDVLPDDEDDAVAIVMADLALATPDALDRLFAADGDLVLAPGRGGGTNALVVRDPEFAVDYHGASIRDHRAIAAEAGLEVVEVDSMRLATDVDEPADLVEVLLHGRGESRTWLREAGFEVATTDGRVTVERSE